MLALSTWFRKRSRPARPSSGLVCPICGGADFKQNDVLWDDLIREWELNSDEVLYINRQQGFCCSDCGSNLRSMTLAAAIVDCYGTTETFQELCSNSRAVKNLALLELNEAGTLSSCLSRLRRHHLARYPEVDMQCMPFANYTWDAIVHSDVLEHVHSPAAALSECYRVLKPGGILFFTVPVVYGRLSRSRKNLAPSYHGNPAQVSSDYLVHTEFGVDVWMLAIAAGFKQVKLFCLTGPESLAIVCFKH